MKDSRLPLFLGLAILAVTGLGVALLGLPDSEVVESEVAEGTETGSPSRQDPVAEKFGTGGREAENIEAKDGAGKFIEPELEVQAIPETPLVVDSFPPTRHSPLNEWIRHKSRAGHFDGVYLASGRQALTPEQTVDGNAVLVVSGWAGDPHLGLRMRDVVLSQCSRVVARARVAQERADVADAVHPNLARSGWEAVIHAADLAICAEPVLRAWAVLPGRPAALLPLSGQYPLAPVRPAAQIEYHLSALPTLTPATVEPPAVGEIEVTASRVNLRRCGSVNCSRVGQIDGGRHRAFVAERHDGWSLVIFGDRAGWMSDKLYRRAE